MAMVRRHRRSSWLGRQLRGWAGKAAIISIITTLAVGALFVRPSRSEAQESVAAADDASSQDGAAATTLSYVIHFYPRWFTYNQENLTATNQLIGPNRMSPIYHDVVAPNDDTIYVSSFMDLTSQPMILFFPATIVTYSVLVLDPYGNIFSNLPIGSSMAGGTYALTGPNFTGTLPAGVIPVPVPLNVTQWIIRADKFSPTGVDETGDALEFRLGLASGTLSEYLNNPPLNPATIAPVELASIPFKGTADRLCTQHPIQFLKQLQVAVASPGTPPLSADEQALSDRFNQLFAKAGSNLTPFMDATRKAHRLIVADYVTNNSPATDYWIHFTNIGVWTDAEDLDRSAITEFIQYGNGIDTAAYYQTFKDSTGKPLIANGAKGYVLKFKPGQTPDTDRFWSVTAYLPGSITLVPNDANKYVVGSYTPGLQSDPDGSISIYMFPDLPEGVPASNWLPVPRGQFNIMLRDYGPAGRVSNNTYVAPPIVATRVKQLPK
jgi:hypothetical protein